MEFTIQAQISMVLVSFLPDLKQIVTFPSFSYTNSFEIDEKKTIKSQHIILNVREMGVKWSKFTH